MQLLSPVDEKRLHCEQQRMYVNALVDMSVQAIASIWPSSAGSPVVHRPIASLNIFLHHILKQSRTTHSTLQLAIFYLFRIRPRIHSRYTNDVYVSCGRRMFLASLICAHKYLQDKTYKNSAWSKISGLNVKEINHAERVMLQLLDYRLYVKKDTYDQWMAMLQKHLKIRPVPSHHRPPHPTDEATDRSIPTKPTAPNVLPFNRHTVMHLGMPTPVELSKPMALPSPLAQERKRRPSLDNEPTPAKRIRA
ncbi:cyclin-domain-containing protein [Radiomyces spectabilis]|uniref:cyclin-domain-containing protein n=1 Tax=Radiomyces spectabilis TaxID=64574 RepID=UPI00221F45E6|nr:cyclin-domain-containing protein [Radiomyces spectabilis]KAI8371609.1 cyclin-domain-containing protein [Radiomyces spectabilis]